MNQLRQKIEVEPARPKYLLTEAGVGYRLIDELPGDLNLKSGSPAPH